MSNLLELSIFRPSSALVPSKRTTIGSTKPTFSIACRIPFAIRSHRTMPPKMLTKIALTFLPLWMISNAFATLSDVVPPPTSRKFAGEPP